MPMYVRKLRLHCPLFYVDVRLAEHEGRWIASATTPDGPSLGLGFGPAAALLRSLDPFDSLADELLDTAPGDLFWTEAG
jgi:hypothetical protein